MTTDPNFPKIKRRFVQRPAIHIDGKWCYTAESAARTYVASSNTRWKRIRINWTEKPYSDMVWARKDILFDRVLPIFKRYLP